MDQLDNHDYYLARAGTARKLAQRAASASVAAIHADLASRYEATVAELERTVALPGGGAQAA